MPRRRTYYRKRRPYKKKTWTGRTKSKKSRAKYRTRASVGRLPGVIVPDRAFTKLKYTQRLSLTSTAGVGNTYQFRGNDLYDPDYTSTGAQPEGYDQWAAFYTQFRVYGSKISVKFVGVGTTQPTQSFELCLVPSSLTNTYSTMEDAMAAPYSVFAVKNVSNETSILKSYMGTRKMEGIPKATILDLDYAGTTSPGSTPTRQWIWNIIVEAADRTSTATVIAYVTITYYAEFFHRQNLTLS